MPEGPLGAPRLTNIGPLSRATEDELEMMWRECPKRGTEAEICKEIKKVSITILENQGFFAECGTLADINSGSCARVSQKVAREVPEATEIRIGDGEHFWVRYKGRHYDAEVPTGVDDWRNFPIFNRVPEDAMLSWARMTADIDGEELPETLEETVTEVDR